MTTGEPILDDEWLTVADLAAMLPFDAATFYTWRARGEGPPSFVLGKRRVVYRRSDVKAWLADQIARPRQSTPGAASGRVSNPA